MANSKSSIIEGKFLKIDMRYVDFKVFRKGGETKILPADPEEHWRLSFKDGDNEIKVEGDVCLRAVPGTSKTHLSVGEQKLLIFLYA